MMRTSDEEDQWRGGPVARSTSVRRNSGEGGPMAKSKEDQWRGGLVGRGISG
jgi:hypothetical protein